MIEILREKKVGVPLNSPLITGRAPPNYLLFSGYATNALSTNDSEDESTHVKNKKQKPYHHLSCLLLQLALLLIIMI